MNDRLITVAAYWDSIEADLARCRLEDAGIRTFLADEQTVGMAWYLGNAIGGAKLQVSESDAKAAAAVLSQNEAADWPDRADGEPESAGSLGEPSGSLVDEESNEPERILTARDENADRALRGAVIGLLLIPLQLYVFWLLLKVFTSAEKLHPDKRRTAIWAAAINFPFMIFIGVYVKSMFFDF